VHYDPKDKRRRDVKYMTGKRRIEETEETEEDGN
jgi:hypothetical protein